MANTLLTSTVITRKALQILHAKLKFISKINREYDGKFAVSGAKIGTTLQIRKPVKYVARTGAAISTQDATETYTSLAVSAQLGVDLPVFTSVELTMSIDDFAERFLEPAMAVLASKIESMVLCGGYIGSTFVPGLYQKVSDQVGNPLSVLNSTRPVNKAGQILTDNLAPDGKRIFLLNTDSRVEMVEANKGLFQSSTGIAEQYEKGILGTIAGFDFAESTLLPVHTPGAYVGTPLTDYGTAFVSGTATLNVNGWTGTVTGILKAGDIITIDGCYAVHPETKATLGYLKRFVVTADVDSSSGVTAAIPIYPAPIYTTSTINSVTTPGAFNNVSALPGNDKTVTVIGTASTPYGVNLAFHKNFATFATADLVDTSQYGAKCSREVFDGISLRLAQQYAISSDTLLGRFDVLCGWAPLYPELACRVANAISAT